MLSDLEIFIPKQKENDISTAGSRKSWRINSDYSKFSNELIMRCLLPSHLDLRVSSRAQNVKCFIQKLHNFEIIKLNSEPSVQIHAENYRPATIEGTGNG